ncbi:MAG: hypothetical protein LBL21_01840 [Rickettsiales bacterium]|jgi:hypothetical protein|nr:hypothetical protein [Rickettsiales bacterium]
MKSRIDDIHFVNWYERTPDPIFIVRWSEHYTIFWLDFRLDKKRKFGNEDALEASSFYFGKIAEKEKLNKEYRKREMNTGRFARILGR